MTVTAEALIELFKSISVLGEWTKNRLWGNLRFPNRSAMGSMIGCAGKGDRIHDPEAKEQTSVEQDDTTPDRRRRMANRSRTERSVVIVHAT
jgi:hypothetical protein